MAHRISFLPYSEWDPDRGCMAFIALVDFARARCLIRAEALVEVAQQDAASPIRTFSEYRDVIEDLAREMIQNERLDGSELVIRLSDVQESRANRVATAESSAPSSPPVAVAAVDGRRMTMTEDARVSVWQALCNRQKAQFDAVSRGAAETLASRAEREMVAFENQHAPETAHELNVRRVEAGRMAESWRAEWTGAMPVVVCSTGS